MEKYKQFKSLLEYFIAHLNWIQTRDVSIEGYNEYIKPLIDSKAFTSTGQGYNQHAIQNQISKWESFEEGRICINVQGNYGSYKSVKCYLNWENTGVNVTANWKKNQIDSLSIKKYSYWENPVIWNSVISDVKISELGLFDKSETENQSLRLFFDTYKEHFIKEQINQQNIKMKISIEQYTTLLLNNYNLILTGAPATGKTYLAKQIASKLILGKEYNDFLSEKEKSQFDTQCKFVQFHPSYDYTDFVEGLRPVNDTDKDSIGFERKNGLFKSFCSEAIDNKSTYLYTSNNNETIKEIRLRPLKKKNLDILYHYFNNSGIKDVSNFKKEDFYKIIIDSRKTKAKTIDFQYYQVVIQEFLNTGNNQDSDFETLYDLFKNKINNSGTLELSIKNRTYIAQLTPTGLIGIKTFVNTENHDNTNSEYKDEIKKKYVFIIDEINRGEISKIMGELFFSIDPGFRGKKGLVNTQYQNLIKESDVFYKGFYVPENVYIIGTMNDIDRSVESIDFAIRRRFAWKEISAHERKEMWNGEIDLWKKEAEKRMDSLNAEIESIPGFNKAYHIGPAYFLKLKNYDGDFKQLWEYHIEGVLVEYFRGMTEAVDLLTKLKKAYELQVKKINDNNG